MRVIQASVIFFLFILLPVDASLAEVEKFIRNDLENGSTESCAKMAVSRGAFIKDVANDVKAKAYIKDLIDLHKTQDRFARKLTEFQLPFIIDNNTFLREYKACAMPVAVQDDKMLQEYIETEVKMDEIFNTAKICPYNNVNCESTTEGLSISEIEDVMAESRNYAELLYLWKKWREATAGLKKMFITMRTLEKHFPQANLSHLPQGDNTSELHYNAYKLWKEVTPLYTELHTYVTRKLEGYYGDNLDVSDGMLPAHILGNMWAKNWYHIEPLVRPFPNVSDGNLEANMKERFNVEDIFRVADEFFKSMGLLSMEATYTANDSMLTKPTDGRAVVCYPNSGDFCNGTYSITVCGKVDLENFIDIFHELGRIQYFMQYKDLPFCMRDSPSAALHEAIGESLALSATSPQHLKRLKLLTNYQDTYESSINFLMKMALIKVAFLPFGLLVGEWNSNVTQLPSSKWNSHWWELRKSYQKLKPPIPRSEDTDFDHVSFYLVMMNADVMAYFYAHFMEFQIYKAFCLKLREHNPSVYKICPLHDCDFYNSKKAGKILGDALRMGNLKSWPDVLEMLTGSRKVLSEPLLEYFQPLYEFLKEENEKAEREKNAVAYDWHQPVLIIFPIFLVVASIAVIIYYESGRRRRIGVNFNVLYRRNVQDIADLN